MRKAGDFGNTLTYILIKFIFVCENADLQVQLGRRKLILGSIKSLR